MPRLGDSIGPYSLTQKLGQGAFGAVWLAERRTSITTTRVALKTPLDGDIDLETIKQEADLWVHASGHPNVVPIIEADVYDGQVVIVSEFAPGGTLADQLSKLEGNPMPVELAADLIFGILAGLEHLHIRNIIHRDLKPANILIQGETPRLTDFGISRILKTTSQSSNIAGTPVYMAPEAFDGKRSAQTDIWSVGVIFYELMTGHLPYPQTDLTSLVGAILTRNPDPLPLSVPTAIQEVITRSLQKDPANRYKSAAEMRQALRNALQIAQSGKRISETPTEISNPMPLPAPPPTAAPQSQRQGIAPQYVYAGAAVVIVLILGGLIVLFKSAQSESPANNASNLQRAETSAAARQNTPQVSSAPNEPSQTSTAARQNAPQISPAPNEPSQTSAAARQNAPQISPAANEPSQSSTSFQRVESKILEGSLLSRSDVAGLTQRELKLLRNTVYARHGRSFQTPDLQRYFDSLTWYTRRNSYTNADLTYNDQANVKLLQKAENE